MKVFGSLFRMEASPVGALVSSEDGGRTADTRVASGDEPDLALELAGALVKAAVRKDVVKRLVCRAKKSDARQSQYRTPRAAEISAARRRGEENSPFMTVCLPGGLEPSPPCSSFSVLGSGLYPRWYSLRPSAEVFSPVTALLIESAAACIVSDSGRIG